jgi:DNA mismatch repair protein MutL
MQPTIQSTIHQLPEHLINKIKAGEVLSSPYFMVKELLENAIDAGATSISLQIQDAGLTSFRIEDNGVGMSKIDLPLSLERHCTSKLNRFEELWDLPTYGFRGEALASIASVAKLVIYSKTKADSHGHRLESAFGKVIGIDESNGVIQQHGTIIQVEQLFENTPVRLNFLSSKIKEKQKLQKMLHALFAYYYHIQFKWSFDGANTSLLKPHASLEERLGAIHHWSAQEVHSLATSYDPINIKFYYGLSSKKLPHGDIIFNGRWLQMGKWSSLIQKELPPHHYYLAIIDLPRSQVDVNIHPNKTELNCLSSPQIISLLLSMLKKTFPKSLGPPVDQSILSHTRPPLAFCLPLAKDFVAYQFENQEFASLIHLPTLQKFVASKLWQDPTILSDTVPLLVTTSWVVEHEIPSPSLQKRIDELARLGIILESFTESWDGKERQGVRLQAISKLYFSENGIRWDVVLHNFFNDIEVDLQSLWNEGIVFEYMALAAVEKLLKGLGIEVILEENSRLCGIKHLSAKDLDRWINQPYEHQEQETKSSNHLRPHRYREDAHGH